MRSPLVILRDFFGPLADRGRTVPDAENRSLKTWADSLQIGWPLDNALVCAVAGVESDEAPKQAPATPLVTVRPLGNIAIGPDVAPYRRAFAPGVRLMT